MNRLKQDGCVTVEPWMEIACELSGEFLLGFWNGISTVQVEHGIWRGQWLGPELERMTPEVYDFVFTQRAVEKALCALGVPAACGQPTCGMDVAIVRDAAAPGGLTVRFLELNARTTMAHYAMAAKRRIPGARRFDCVRVSDLTPNLVPITDPETATTWVVVMEIATGPSCSSE